MSNLAAFLSTSIAKLAHQSGPDALARRMATPARESVAKRVFDVTVSLLALTVVSPILVLVALAIKLEDKGPVFYTSERIGRDGVPFRMWKFRSMACDAESRISALIDQKGQGALLFKLRDDPRVTRVGKFLRKYSLDELPQLFNTLNGTMSLVGPRPQVAREVAEYDEQMHDRLLVTPGITGLWQVSGRSNLTADEAKTLDLYYVYRWTFLLDLLILIKTLPAVLRADGAY